MNYINHTRAAHELLRHQPAATPHHVSLYWALFFAWNAEFFSGALILDHQAMMQAAHIGNQRTYRATLRDLEAWQLLTYQPSKSRHEPSRCLLADLSGAKLPAITPGTRSKAAPDKPSVPGTLLPQALRADLPLPTSLPGAEVPEPSLYDKTGNTKTVPQNGGAAPAKKNRGDTTPENRGPSAGEITADLPPSAQPKTPRIKRGVALKKNGPHTAAIRAAATQANNGPCRPTPELPFSESAIARLDAFQAAFEGTDYALADLRFYHELVANWRDKKTGEPPRRKDWVATAKRFMLNDAHDNRLKLAPGTSQPPGTDAGSSDFGIPTTGYRSSRYD